jgi:outer membrane protein OmpA-like peptidoglycan-associated protein
VSFGTGSVSFGSTHEVSFPEASLPGTAAALTQAASGPVVEASATSLGTGMSMQEEGHRLRFTLNADVLFDFDKAVLRREAGPVLFRLVEEVRARVPDARYRIEGHTDAIGSDAYNNALSGRRAKAVQVWLSRNATVTPQRLTTAAYGKRRPVVPNMKPDGSDDPDGRQKNRRVEILVEPL